MSPNPFVVLGLPGWPDLDDETVLAMVAEIPARICHGHPLRMLIRAAIIAGLCLGLVTAFPGGWADFAVEVLTLHFVVSAAREDLAPPVARLSNR